MLRVVFTDGIFIARTSFENRKKVRAAGFIFDKDKKIWYSDVARAAVKLREHWDSSTKKQLDRSMIHLAPYSGPLPFPKKETLYDHQPYAAAFALSRNRSYLGLAPRLGKSIISAIIGNALQSPIVFIAPPFLTRNVEAEFRRWSVWKPRIVRLDAKEAPIEEPDILIVPDSILHRREVLNEIREFADDARQLGREPLLIADEAHRFKESTAERTKALFGNEKRRGLVADFERQIYLSGTPMPNRPMELYPLLSKVAPETIDFMDKHEYGMKFCGGRWDEFGYDYSGASNLKDLQSRVYGKFMLRLKKVPGLPPKVEETVIIGTLPPKLIAMDSSLLKKYSPEDLVAGKVSSDHVSTYRKELGAIKVKPAIDFLRSLLDESGESILVFAFHKEVIAKLKLGLERYRPLVITGGVSHAERKRIETTFQTDPKRKLFIGQYVACGLGLTLSKADRVVFVEFSWTKTENDQAAERANAIGGKDLLVQYIVYENSIDRKTIETNLRKSRITSYV